MVTGVSLDDHLVKVVFAIFDENGDGELSHKEFIEVLKDRRGRGLGKVQLVFTVYLWLRNFT